MTVALPSLVGLAALATLLQASPQATPLTMRAATATHDELVAEARAHPEELREAFQDLLRASPAYPDPAANRLATAYAEAWHDPFLMTRYRQFVDWSVDERTLKLEADSLRLAGNEAYVSEGVDPALDLWRRSLAEVESLADTAGIARALGNIGAGHYGAGRPDSAAAYYERSRDLALATGDLVAAANARTTLATLRREAGDVQEAGSLYLQALDMHERVGALRSAAFDHHNLGLLALVLGDLDGARREFEAAIELSQRTGHLDDEADHLSSLADVLMVGGEYEQAEANLSLALDLDRETGNRPGEAGVRHSLGLLAMARGDYGLAVRELEQARDQYADLGRVASTVSVQADLGRARAATGDLHRGIAELRNARRIVDGSSIADAVRADLVLTTGDIELTLNEFERARGDYREAERLYRRLEDYGGVAAARHGLAFVYLYQDDFARAEAALRQALETQQAMRDPRATALTRLLLADVYLAAGDLQQAREVTLDAKDVLAAVPDPPGEATALAALGNIELRQGLFGDADRSFQRGLSILANRKAPEISWRLHAGRAATLEARGRQAEALQELRSAVAGIERVAETWTHTRTGSRYLSDKWEVYTRLALLEAESGDVGGAFETSERLRAQRLLATLDRGRIQVRGSESELATREQDLRRRIGELAARAEPSRAGGDALTRGSAASGLTREQADAALEAARRDYAHLLDELADERIPFGDLVRPEISGWKAVSRGLAEDELFLQYLVSDSVALVYAISSEAIQVVPLQTDAASLGDLIGFTRGVLEDPSHGGRSELWRVPLGRLYRILIGPIQAAGLLEDRRHLVVSPHGQLHYLPFPALVDPGGQFLIERFTVATTPSATVWLRLADRPSRVRGGGILAMAPHTSDLPGTRLEMARIDSEFGDRAELLLGTEATEDALVARAGTYDIIHLATFGMANRVNPLFSFVELAPGASGNGRLEAHEIFGLDLDADLVVLSACETGLASGSRADVPAGDDWVGLTRSFLSAGSSAVIATLWPVADLPSADLMGAFYEGLARGNDTRVSLANAQRKLLRQLKTANPYFWAGFILVGEGRGEQ